MEDGLLKVKNIIAEMKMSIEELEDKAEEIFQKVEHKELENRMKCLRKC